MESRDITLRMKRALHHTAGNHYLPELLIYVVVWGIVLLFPVVNNFFDFLSGTVEEMYWKGIFLQWCDTFPFLLLFLLNNRWLAPQLLLRQRVKTYVISVVLLTMLVMGGTSFFDASFLKIRKERMEMMIQQNHPDVQPKRPDVQQKHPDAQQKRPDVQPRHPDAQQKRPASSGKPGEFRPPRDFKRDFPHPPAGNMPLFFPLMRGPFFGRMLVALLMLSFNIAVKLFFKSLHDKERMKELERHNLQSELDYLKYQINPHFFMNTLNSIHALVDIDTEKAKQTIVELSKLMRYMLYEADKCTIQLAKEVHFLRHYIELMRIRYPESIHIELSLPDDDAGEVQVPPLLFISFVENAFKHGISYQKKSFITVSLEMSDGEILFRCSNSNYGKSEDQYHGIGLENIRKRLQLLFGDRYTLSINETEHCFDVLLVVPVD